MKTGRYTSNSREGKKGVTLIELLCVVVILGVMVAIAVPKLNSALEKTRQGRAISDLRVMNDQIIYYWTTNGGKYPSSWNDLGIGPMPADPWGNPYVYQNHALILPFLFRTDGPLIAINSDYDLYSKGRDGLTLPNILGLISQDDIIRADDGGFFGLAAHY